MILYTSAFMLPGSEASKKLTEAERTKTPQRTAHFHHTKKNIANNVY